MTDGELIAHLHSFDWVPCSSCEPACQDPRQFERAFMLADLVAAGLVSFSLAERLADELRLEERCWVPA